MKIAVTYENGQVFQHFGHTKQFQFFEVADGKILSSAIADANGQAHGALAAFLQNNGIDTLICGGIGEGAKKALAGAGITLYGGVSGSTEQAVQHLLAGTLLFNPDITCSHHDGAHSHGHSCSSSHSCAPQS